MQLPDARHQQQQKYAADFPTEHAQYTAFDVGRCTNQDSRMDSPRPKYHRYMYKFDLIQNVFAVDS